MKYLWSSPCSRAGLSAKDNPFPCLDPAWGDRPCPMNSGACKSVRACDAEMYAVGYPYGAWVVREDVLGLSPVCSLTYFREKPTPEGLGALYGKRVLRMTAATPICPADRSDRSLDRKVRTPAVH